MIEPVRYYSYLLRMWQVPSDEDHTCRIRLESVPTGEKYSFSTLDELLVYLRRVLDSDQGVLDGESHSSGQG